VLPASVLEEVGALDPAAIAQVQAEAWPDVRDADELHDVLHTLVAVPEECSRLSVHSGRESRSPVTGHRLPEESLAANWQLFFEHLLVERRAFVAEDAGRRYWVAAEQAAMFAAIHPGASGASDNARTATGEMPTLPDAVLAAVQGWMAHLGPTTAREIGELIGVSAAEVEKALLRVEASGAVLRGKFRTQALKPVPIDQFEGSANAIHFPPVSASSVSTDEPDLAPDTRTGVSTPHEFASAKPEIEWCERRLLARIHRLTVATLRKQIEPVTASQFMNWLLRWQHIAPGSQVRGEHGTLEVLRQLQGFEVPANTWERFVLGRRISDYEPAYLDQLCLAGVVGWGRLSPHPVMLESGASDANGVRPQSNEVGPDGQSSAPVAARVRRVIPTRVAPIAFFVREESDWMTANPSHTSDAQMSFLSPVARELHELMKQRGALFFPDMVRATGRLKAEVETGLWELVAVGLVTADGFENLRTLVAPKTSPSATPGSAGFRMAGAAKSRRPRHAAGRWSLLHEDAAEHSARAKSAAERDRSVESCCWMLLRRYGVVFRDLLARETNLPRWRELQIAFRRLEDRGEVRGGRFVDGFQGEQFALPVAVESLRANRKLPLNGERVVIAAADPLNLVGIVVPGERIPAISGRSVTFRDGAWEPEHETLIAAGL